MRDTLSKHSRNDKVISNFFEKNEIETITLCHEFTNILDADTYFSVKLLNFQIEESHILHPKKISDEKNSGN